MTAIPKNNLTVEEDDDTIVTYYGSPWENRSSPHDHGSKHWPSQSPDASATFTIMGLNSRYCYVFMVKLIYLHLPRHRRRILGAALAVSCDIAPHTGQ